jgi:hypothetical protein
MCTVKLGEKDKGEREIMVKNMKKSTHSRPYKVE